MRRFTQSGRRRTLARSNKSFCRNRSSDRSFLRFFFATWIHRRGNQEVLISELRPQAVFFFYRSKQSISSTDDREKGRAERNNEVSIYRNIILFIGILCRDFKLIAIVGDYRKGGRTLIILSLSISSKMLARCCLRIRQPRRNRFEY